MSKPISITTILPDGDPNGLRVLEPDTFPMKSFVVPRSQLGSFAARQEASHAGIYFLFGEGEDKPITYIGKTRSLVDRIRGHDRDREDEAWNTAVLFTVKDDLIGYLESVSVEKARNAGQYEIINQNQPGQNVRLSEAQKISADKYREMIQVVLTLLDYQLFQEVPKEVTSQTVYFLEDARNKDAQGKGTLLPPKRFVVFAGSKARVHETKSFAKHVNSSLSLRRQLVSESVLKPAEDGKSFIFTKDQIFSSPSQAADVVHGRACNGWTGWKDQHGHTLDSIVRGE